MQDLLNEEEFTQQINYNPWKRFLVFYGIAVVHIFLTYFFSRNVEMQTARPYIILSLLIILVMPFFMILDHKKVMHCSKTVILQGIQLLMSIYYVASITADLAKDGFYRAFDFWYIKMTLYGFLVTLSYGFFCYCCIWLILRYKKRRKKVTKVS